MSARDAILNRVRNACGRDSNSPLISANCERDELLEELPASVQQRINSPAPLTQPAVALALTDALVAQMESVQMTVVRLQSDGEVIAAIDWYLQEHDISGELSVAPALKHLEWKPDVNIGAATGTEATSVTNAFAAVAETGSIAMASGADTPATLNFLPENHIVVLYESQIVEHLEDVWTQMRGVKELPRAISLVTGPSRTGDIEQTIELGAHGPRRMHVLLISDELRRNTD